MKPNYYGNPYKIKIKSGSTLYLGPSIFLSNSFKAMGMQPTYSTVQTTHLTFSIQTCILNIFHSFLFIFHAISSDRRHDSNQPHHQPAQQYHVCQFFSEPDHHTQNNLQVAADFMNPFLTKLVYLKIMNYHNLYNNLKYRAF